MELEQWIAIYGAVTHNATARIRSFWSLLVGGMLVAAVFSLAFSYLEAFALSGIPVSLEIGTIGFALFLGIGWLAAQCRLLAEVHHWERMLRSLESQFAGGEFQRSQRRLEQGESVCVAGSTWICDDWQNEAVRFSRLTRTIPQCVAVSIPAGFVAALVAFLVKVTAF